MVHYNSWPRSDEKQSTKFSHTILFVFTILLTKALILHIRFSNTHQAWSWTINKKGKWNRKQKNLKLTINFDKSLTWFDQTATCIKVLEPIHANSATTLSSETKTLKLEQTSNLSLMNRNSTLYFRSFFPLTCSVHPAGSQSGDFPASIWVRSDLSGSWFYVITVWLNISLWLCPSAVEIYPGVVRELLNAPSNVFSTLRQGTVVGGFRTSRVGQSNTLGQARVGLGFSKTSWRTPNVHHANDENRLISFRTFKDSLYKINSFRYW